MTGGLRTPTRWLSCAALTIVLAAGCSGGVDGTAAKATPTYQPLPIATASAVEIALPEQTMAVATDGTKVLVRDEDQWCVSEVGGAATTCLALPDDAKVGQAAFSPDGTHLALNEDFALTMRGRMWVADVADGSVQEVPPLDRTSAAPSSPATTSEQGTAPTEDQTTGQTTAQTPTTTRTTSTRDRSSESTYAGSTFDQDTGALVAMEFGFGDDRRDALVRVDPATATPTPVATLDQRYGGQLTAGGGIVAMSVFKDGRPGGVITVSEADGSIRELDQQVSGLFAEGVIVFPDALSPDGTRLLVKGVDPRQLNTTMPTIIDLTGAAPPATLPGFADNEPWTAAFSPDGTQVVLLVRSKEQEQPLSLVVSDGTTTRVVAQQTNDMFPQDTGLTWSAGNVVTPAATRSYLRGSPVAWQLS